MPVQRKRKRPIAPAPFPGLLAPASRALQYHVKNPHQRTNTGISGRNELLISDWAQARSPIMKRTLLPFLGCVLLAGCSTGHGPETSLSRWDYASKGQATNSFAIYLTAERINPASASTNLSQVRLTSPPVISEADIVTADFINGVIRLRPEAFKRLPEASVEGTFFVVAVDGERLFPGAFWTWRSSRGPVADATIQLDRVQGQDYLFLGWNDLAGGSGGSGWGGPWSDPRVKQCLQKLHKLGHVKTL